MNHFQELRQSASQGTPAVLGKLVEILRQEKKWHELFEALKMQVRQASGLPILYSDTPDDLTEQQRLSLEEGLLAACKEVGSAFLRQGDIREGWMYLRPVGDKTLVAELLKDQEPNDETVEDWIELLLQEGTDVARGYQLVLDHLGVCNAITTYDTSLIRHPKSDQQAAARLLLIRLHADLLENVKTDIQRQEGTSPAENKLKEILADREWLTQEGQYHIDTTHLASTVRIARILEDETSLRLALDLTEYGKLLHSQFQFHGDEPFVEIYPSHAMYFQALLDIDREASLDYFRSKARELDIHQHGTIAVEVLIDLLARCQRLEEAIDTLLEMIPQGTPALGVAPSLYELCLRAGDFSKLLAASEAKADLLGFTAGIVSQGSR